jgi:hypothetical protein
MLSQLQPKQWIWESPISSFLHTAEDGFHLYGRHSYTLETACGEKKEQFL